MFIIKENEQRVKNDLCRLTGSSSTECQSNGTVLQTQRQLLLLRLNKAIWWSLIKLLWIKTRRGDTALQQRASWGSKKKKNKSLTSVQLTNRKVRPVAHTWNVEIIGDRISVSNNSYKCNCSITCQYMFLQLIVIYISYQYCSLLCNKKTFYFYFI